MTIKYDKIMSSKKDLESIDRTNPANVAAALIHTFPNYKKDDTSNFYEMLQFLVGEYQPISEMMKQNIKDRMMQNNKIDFIGKSYFKGAIPSNDYTPSVPYEIEVIENDYSDDAEGYKRLFLKSGGADSPRPITLRLAKDGNYYVWSDSFIGLLADIRGLESENPWA
ncbi:MAG: hypothetical protein E7158_00235 [Firmicutes bacterium]|nr:hypothetical protein [Bacillota bacterium]